MGINGKYRSLVGGLCALLLCATPAGAAPCRLALVLALDVSSSVDAHEDLLQRKGLAAALLAPEVERAFFAAPGPVALAVYEWSGRYDQHVLLDWRLIEGPPALLAAAETLAASPRSRDDLPTAMGYALGYGAGMLGRAPPCLSAVIDISGDGLNNEGFGPRLAYGAFPFAGVRVNGLVIAGGDGDENAAVVTFYASEVVHGPGAFLETADGFEDFERSMRRKLTRELGPPMIGAVGAGPRRGRAG